MFKMMERKMGTRVGFVGALVACVLLLPALCGGAETQKNTDSEDLRNMVESLAATLTVVSEDNAALRREIAFLREELASLRGTQQKPAAGNTAMLREMQSAERASQIRSLLRTMKSAAVIFYAEELGSIMENPTRFREKVNGDPLAVRNILGKYLDVPATYDESCHFYVLNDNQWLVGYDLAGEDESTLERLAAMARQPGANLV
ncbi:hypothetical protein, partial [uncultured Fretibacterium sp.]|uniref:hypothetical protein n=1 Tax=uncultured Fretibacterium sp. TaxID=1678694 RepID=UPI0026040308